MEASDFVAANYEQVRRSLAVAVGDRSWAEELTQEAFAQAWRRWSSVSRMERPVAWVYVVAINRARKRWRRERDVVVDHEPIDFGVADQTASVATSISLKAAIDQLPPRQRAAVVLRFLADLTVAEVAEAMGCAEGTVKSTLHAALAHLRVELEEDER